MQESLASLRQWLDQRIAGGKGLGGEDVVPCHKTNGLFPAYSATSHAAVGELNLDAIIKVRWWLPVVPCCLELDAWHGKGESNQVGHDLSERRGKLGGDYGQKAPEEGCQLSVWIGLTVWGWLLPPLGGGKLAAFAGICVVETWGAMLRNQSRSERTAMEPNRQGTAEFSQNDQPVRATNDGERDLWNSVEELRVRSGLKFDEYAKSILGLIFLGYVNRQAHTSGGADVRPGGALTVPPKARWEHLLSLPRPQIGDATNKAMAAIESENEALRCMLQADYNRIHNSVLGSLLNIFSQVTAESNEATFARIYDDFLDRFARASGQRAGEFSSPREIAELLISLVKPHSGMSVYDPCAGTAGFLREAVQYVSPTGQGDSSLSLYGQEISEEILSIGRMHLAVNGVFNADLRLGDTLNQPRHVLQDGLMQFDRVVANPPFAVSLQGAELEQDPYHRFQYGIPPRSHGDFAFIQHMIASLKPDGVMAVVVSHGVLFRGGREGEIRRRILEDDLLEAVIGLPPDLFYTTGLSAAIVVFNKNKPPERSNKILFINADRDFERIGRQKSLRPEGISRITTTFDNFSDVERYSKVVALDEIRANSYNLNILRYADSSPLAGLVTQYDSFAKYTIKALAVQINAAKRGGHFEAKPNAVYIAVTGKYSTDVVDDLQGKHDRYHQVVLNDRASSAYVAQFLGTSVGQHALAVQTAGTVVQRLSKADLEECMIALPPIETQHEIVATHGKLASLKKAISDFDRELSLNPTGLAEFQQQLDSMLKVIGALSEADYLRSIIRQGESKTVEFKETFSLDVRKDTKEKYIEESSLKTIVAFLNSDGGSLLIGIADDQTIAGIDVEIKKFHKDVIDKCLLHFKNTIRSRIGEEFYPFVNYRIVEADGRHVLLVECEPSERPCFLDEKAFYVRTNPATDKLEGMKQYEYIKHRFGV